MNEESVEERLSFGRGHGEQQVVWIHRGWDVGHDVVFVDYSVSELQVLLDSLGVEVVSSSRLSESHQSDFVRVEAGRVRKIQGSHGSQTSSETVAGHPDPISRVLLVQFGDLFLHSALEEEVPEAVVEVRHHSTAVDELLPSSQLSSDSMDELLEELFVEVGASVDNVYSLRLFRNTQHSSASITSLIALDFVSLDQLHIWSTVPETACRILLLHCQGQGIQASS